MKNPLNTFKVLALAPLLALMTACSVSADAPGGFSIPSGTGKPDRQSANFDSWSVFAGRYDLVSFDGKDISDDYRIGVIEIDSTRYQDATGKNLKMMAFPLYGSITPNSATIYVFGPLNGLGTSVIDRQGVQTTQIYDYVGPINWNGGTYDMSLHLEAFSDFSNPDFLTLTYTLEVKGQIQKTSHTLVMRVQ
ncbi:MAG: hypothetical protein V4692_12975 [Bdellovibrionota bacterium]